MDKTLLKKLTENHYYHTPALVYPGSKESPDSLAFEMGLLREAARDLMQPRPQAVARLLQMAREM